MKLLVSQVLQIHSLLRRRPSTRTFFPLHEAGRLPSAAAAAALWPSQGESGLSCAEGGGPRFLFFFLPHGLFHSMRGPTTGNMHQTAGWSMAPKFVLELKRVMAEIRSVKDKPFYCQSSVWTIVFQGRVFLLLENDLSVYKLLQK